MDKAQKIEKLRKQIAACQRCSLAKTRTHTVPGEGDVASKIMFIGEAPGRNEDLQGKPFVGRAGDIFDELLHSIGLTRNDIYLCNILKCRPPQNRNPSPSEIQACKGSLELQIKLIDPLVIGTLGNFSTQYILDRFGLPQGKISALRGRIFDVSTPTGHKKIIPLFHPAVATYDGSKKDILLKDFQILKPLLAVQESQLELNSL